MKPLVLYDGVCGLCDKAVQWLIDHDVEQNLRYAALQGATAEGVRRDHPELPENIDSILFLDGDRLRWRSHALWAICAHLPAPWSWARVLLWVPAPLSDLGYRVLASIRYRVWGKLDVCRIPSPEQMELFLP
jgi:predicted DCC family thiol-disulfide oxidoreductase YuxK